MELSCGLDLVLGKFSPFNCLGVASYISGIVTKINIVLPLVTIIEIAFISDFEL